MSQPRKAPPTSLGRLVRFWRKTFSLSQEELALQLQSSTRHISRLETGKVHPSREVVLSIAQFFNLKKRDAANLLIAAGYIPEIIDADFRAPEYRWLRKTMAINFKSLDPYPAMLTDRSNNILMCNKSWLGLFQDRFDFSGNLYTSNYLEAIIDAIAAGANENDRENILCAFCLSIKQEALINQEPILDTMLSRLEKRHGLPKNWPQKAAQFEPRMSVPISFDIDGEKHEFYHVCNAITSLGPVENGTEPSLVIMKLFPKDIDRDLSLLTAHELDHPSLYTHEIRKNES